MSLKASRTPSKIDDIPRIIAGVDDDFDVPDWGWGPWWRYGWTLLKMDDIAGGFEDAWRSWLELMSLIMIVM